MGSIPSTCDDGLGLPCYVQVVSRSTKLSMLTLLMLAPVWAYHSSFQMPVTGDCQTDLRMHNNQQDEKGKTIIE